MEERGHGYTGPLQAHLTVDRPGLTLQTWMIEAWRWRLPLFVGDEYRSIRRQEKTALSIPKLRSENCLELDIECVTVYSTLRHTARRRER
jgi:hypothetical protein